MRKIIASLTLGASVFATGCATTMEQLQEFELPAQIPNLFTDSFDKMFDQQNQAALSARKQELANSGIYADTTKVKLSNSYASSSQAYANTTVQGVALGAVIGGVGCKYLASANDTQTGLCAAAGGLAGLAFANLVNSEARELTDDRAKLEAELQQAENNRAAAQVLVNETQDNIVYLESVVAGYKNDLAQNKISQQQYEANIIEARQIAIAMTADLDKVKSDVEAQKKLFTTVQKNSAKSEETKNQDLIPAIEKSINADDEFLNTEVKLATQRVVDFEKDLGAA